MALPSGGVTVVELAEDTSWPWRIDLVGDIRVPGIVGARAGAVRFHRALAGGGQQ